MHKFCGGVQHLAVNAIDYSEELSYGDYLTYQQVDIDNDGIYDYIQIIDCDESAENIEVPSEIDGLPVTSIKYRAFENCTSLESVVIPESVTDIGNMAFENTALLNNQTGIKYADNWVIGCDTDVTTAEIKDGTVGIAYYAFEDCTSLESVIMPDSVTIMVDWAFFGCTSLKNVTISNGITCINTNTFAKCESLESIIIPDSVTEIGYQAFWASGLKSIDIPDSVTVISSWAFLDCSKLKDVNMGKGVKVMYEGAFSECASLENITLSENLTHICPMAFSSCSSLADIKIPDTVIKIGHNSFTDTAIANNQTGVIYADDWAVELSSSMEKIELKDGTVGIAENVLRDCEGLKEIYLPTSFGDIDGTFDPFMFKSETLEKITVSDDNESFCDDDGVLLSKDKTILEYYPSGNKNTEYIFPETVTGTCFCAFFGAANLQRVVVTENVEKIGSSAFANCTNLKEIVFENSNCELLDASSTSICNECEVGYMEASMNNSFNNGVYNGVIYGYEDSIAQAYANEFGYEFAEISGLPDFIETVAGDANDDGKLNVRDCAFIASALAKGLADTLPKSADFNGDGKINVRDAAAIAKVLAEK